MARVKVTITTEDSEVLETFTVGSDEEASTPMELAKEIVEHVGLHFDVED